MKANRPKTIEGTITPPDTERCQAEVPNGYSFMTLGGKPGRERCSNTPVTIATERSAGPDGQCGSMSLCPTCWRAFIMQMPVDFARFEPITKGSP